MPLADLAATPGPVADATELIDRIDHAFVGGFARLAGDHLSALESLRATFAATPLAERLGAAVEGIGRSEFDERHFLVLAAARATLQGAQHDALVAQASAALGRPTPRPEVISAGPAQAPPPQHDVWMESARNWLMELALAGFANLGMDTLLPFESTLDPIESDGRLARHATLLGGFLDEMLSVFPAKGTPDIPIFRWADLWSRAMVLSATAPAPAASRPVQGTLRVLGADLRQHDTFATLVAFGVLREAGRDTPRLVRATISAFKVDVIQGDELGTLFGNAGGKLLDAIAGFKELAISDMPLLATNDLVWLDDRAKVGAAFDPMAEAAAALGAAPADRPCLDAADRHPALIEELVHLTGYDVKGSDEMTITAGGATLPVAHGRWPETDDLEPGDLKGSTAMVGLLRFDAGRWSIQPLAVTNSKKKVRAIGSSLAANKGKKSKTGALPTLKEKADKLLRDRKKK